MKQELEAIRAKALEAIGGAEKAEDLEALRVQYLGKKGELTAILKQMGKLSAEEIRQAVLSHPDCHMVKPALVYLSQPTELGTLYTLSELKAIRAVCDKMGLLLYCDGARLASALTAKGNDVFLPDLARLCDAFYIGGTKCGALFGEALVFCKPELARNFAYTRKQRGGLLAKGRLLGVQFDALFTDGLFYKIGKEADEKALKIARALKEKGYTLYLESPTNQQFVKVSEAKCAEWEKHMRVNRFQILVDEGTAFQTFHSCILTQHEIGGVAGHTFSRESVWDLLDLDICDRAIFQLDKDIQKQEGGGRQHAVFI